jgi:hypothetical protein
MTTTAFDPNIENVAMKRCQLATVGWQQPSAGNNKKCIEVNHTLVHLFLKHENIFFAMNGMRQVYSCQNQAALKEAEF